MAKIVPELIAQEIFLLGQTLFMPLGVESCWLYTGLS
jgi:hypothetical protein